MSNVEKFLEAGGVSQALYTQKYVDKKDNEIKRLKNDIKRITEITNQKIKIINDVREYMNTKVNDNINDIYEILDRVGDKE